MLLLRLSRIDADPDVPIVRPPRLYLRPVDKSPFFEFIEVPCAVRGVLVDHRNVRHGPQEAFRGIEPENPCQFPVYQKEFALVGGPVDANHGVVHEVEPQTFPRPQLSFGLLAPFQQKLQRPHALLLLFPPFPSHAPVSMFPRETSPACHAILFREIRMGGGWIETPFSTISIL